MTGGGAGKFMSDILTYLATFDTCEASFGYKVSGDIYPGRAADAPAGHWKMRGRSDVHDPVRCSRWLHMVRWPPRPLARCKAPRAHPRASLRELRVRRRTRVQRHGFPFG